MVVDGCFHARRRVFGECALNVVHGSVCVYVGYFFLSLDD